LQRKKKAPTTGFLTAAADLATKLKNAPLAPVLRNQIKSDLVNVSWKSDVEKWIEQQNIKDVISFCVSEKSAKLPKEFRVAISEYLKNAIGVLEEFDFAGFIRSLGSSTQELKNLKFLRSKLSTRCALVEPFLPNFAIPHSGLTSESSRIDPLSHAQKRLSCQSRPYLADRILWNCQSAFVHAYTTATRNYLTDLLLWESNAVRRTIFPLFPLRSAHPN
jgi:hypothetical protein